MRYPALIIIGMAVLLLGSNMMSANGDEDPWSYQDEENDVLVLGQNSSFEDDIDIVSLTCDASGDPIVLTMTVVGNIVAEYGENGTNNYVIALDLDGDEEEAEVGVQFTGADADKEAYVTIITSDDIEYLSESEYEISGSMITVRIARGYLGEYEDVLDFTATNLQIMNTGTGTDAVNFDFGEDNKPYDDSSPADDDTGDDDTSDDDDTEDEGSTEKDSICGSAFLLSIALLASVLILLSVYVRRNK
ncbi:MAG: hypothetical protein U9R75_07475 [Candidatus Thermoplasmatota archaeon]|nr:hypothetical protein [Candidatus Thermoplasmatota archaeon]